MKTLLLCLVLVAYTALTPGFPQASQKIEKMLNLGLGMQSYALGGLCNGASFELGFPNNISVGGFFDYALYGTKFGDRRWKSQYASFGVRGSFHLADALGVGNDKFDPYVGLSVGTRTVIHRTEFEQESRFIPRLKGVIPGVHVGGFYHFSQKIGGFAEMGRGIAALRLGVTGKF
ncbi:hypothetical protein [Larkinella arboricola]